MFLFTPLFSSYPPLKVEVLSSPSLFENLVGGSTPPPPQQKGGEGVYTMQTIIKCQSRVSHQHIYLVF